MRCKEVRDQFADYVISDSDAPALSGIAHHLKTCESCRAEAEELRTLWTALGSIPVQAEPNASARASFNLMLEAYKQGMERPTTSSWRQGMNAWLAGWWPRQPAYQFLLALGVLALGVGIGVQMPFSRPVYPIQPNPEIVELRRELLEMRQMVALSLMQQQSASDRLRGVNVSYELPHPGTEVLRALLDTLTHDPNVNVRLATVDALRQFGDQTVVRKGIVEAMPRQESAMVQVALIDLAVDLHEKGSLDTLRQFSSDEKLDIAVRERARKGLAQME
jgi:hypothetical protein